MLVKMSMKARVRRVHGWSSPVARSSAGWLVGWLVGKAVRLEGPRGVNSEIETDRLTGLFDKQLKMPEGEVWFTASFIPTSARHQLRFQRLNKKGRRNRLLRAGTLRDFREMR